MNAATNGIVLREDFKLAVKIFGNAFNPLLIPNPTPTPGNSMIKNPLYDPNWDPVSAFVLSQSELRLEQPLSATSTNYLFPVLTNIQNQAQQFPSEIRLTNQDSFVPTQIGVYVAKPSGTLDTTFLLYTSFNPTVFPNAVAENAFYNGQLKLMINNKQYINGWGLVRHKMVSQTQQTVSPLVGTDLQEQFDGSGDGLYPMQPFVILTGTQNIQLTIQLPNAITAIDANSRVIIRMVGVLAQNSTSTT